MGRAHERFFYAGFMMWLLGLGLLLAFLKYNEMSFAAAWSWWVVLSPFAMAVVWWAWADASGYTKRKAMEKMDQKQRDRRAQVRDRLGMGARKR